MSIQTIPNASTRDELGDLRLQATSFEVPGFTIAPTLMSELLGFNIEDFTASFSPEGQHDVVELSGLLVEVFPGVQDLLCRSFRSRFDEGGGPHTDSTLSGPCLHVQGEVFGDSPTRLVSLATVEEIVPPGLFLGKTVEDTLAGLGIDGPTFEAEIRNGTGTFFSGLLPWEKGKRALHEFKGAGMFARVDLV